MENTYGNIGKENSVALNLFVDCNLKSKTSVRLNGNVAYIDLRVRKYRQARGMAIFGDRDGTTDVGMGYPDDGAGGYIGSRVSLQTDYPGSYYYVFCGFDGGEGGGGG